MKATEVVWSLFESMDEIVDFLQIQLIGDTYNLKINPDDVFTDMVAYYKSNQFDPLQPLKVQYIGQPAADTGRVLWQCFTDLFNAYLENWFVGSGDIKLPG